VAEVYRGCWPSHPTRGRARGSRPWPRRLTSSGLLATFGLVQQVKSLPLRQPTCSHGDPPVHVVLSPPSGPPTMVEGSPEVSWLRGRPEEAIDLCRGADHVRPAPRGSRHGRGRGVPPAGPQRADVLSLEAEVCRHGHRRVAPPATARTGQRAAGMPAHAGASTHLPVPERRPGSDGLADAAARLSRRKRALWGSPPPPLASARGQAGQASAGLQAVSAGRAVAPPEASPKAPQPPAGRHARRSAPNEPWSLDCITDS